MQNISFFVILQLEKGEILAYLSLTGKGVDDKIQNGNKIQGKVAGR